MEGAECYDLSGPDLAQHSPLCSTKACCKERLGEARKEGEPLLASPCTVLAGCEAQLASCTH